MKKKTAKDLRYGWTMWAMGMLTGLLSALAFHV
jgi:hypothetical protein